MEEKKFNMFTGLLKRIEADVMNNTSIENSIINIIDSSEKSMTEEQKAKIYNEFVHYERTRREHMKDKRHNEYFEEEKYKEVLQQFFKDFSGW